MNAKAKWNKAPHNPDTRQQNRATVIRQAASAQPTMDDSAPGPANRQANNLACCCWRALLLQNLLSKARP